MASKQAGKAHRGFGSVRKLSSGRYQARYTGPDRQQHAAPYTFQTKGQAEDWLAEERTKILRGKWHAEPQHGPVTFETYATQWLAGRELKPRSREHYQKLLDQHLIPAFGKQPLSAISPAAVRAWYASWGTKTPTLRAHAYGLLRTILGGAVEDRAIDFNPAHIRGAGRTKRAKKIRPATLAELEAIVNAMPERLRLMVLLGAWCALRFGELAELRRDDVDTKAGVIRVRRGVVRVDGEKVVGTPKTDAGTRDVAIPPHLLPAVREHLLRHAGEGPDGLLFPAADGTSNLAPSSLYGKVATKDKPGWGWYHARQVAARSDLRFHDLRHTGAVLAASTGATLAELMGRLGHSSPAAALRYQHAAADRDKVIAEALSRLATGTTE